ncbi:hypothetical protein G6F65_020544 [Rhizopus arrhizus]|nr:hypothetical protein G6F65_020544 [Rhizopus arrhizus]
MVAQALGVVDRARPTHVMGQVAVVGGLECRVLAGLVIGLGQFLQRADQGFGDEAAAIAAEVALGIREGVIVGNGGGRHGYDRWFKTGGYSSARVMTGKWILSGAYRQEISHEQLIASAAQCAARVRGHRPPGRGRPRRAGPACHPRCGQPAAEAAGGSSGHGLVPACRSRPAPDRRRQPPAGGMQRGVHRH